MKLIQRCIEKIEIASRIDVTLITAQCGGSNKGCNALERNGTVWDGTE
jgi:hypothetical protein